MARHPHELGHEVCGGGVSAHLAAKGFFGVRRLWHTESDNSGFMEVYIMRIIISIILMVIAALVGFFFGAGMNEAMGGAILLSMITGFACTISAIEKNKKA